MPDIEKSNCRFCQHENPPGTKFCGSCGNILVVPLRGSATRRPGWFERAGANRVLGFTLGPSGIASAIAIGVFSMVSLTLWASVLIREGRLFRKPPPVVLTAKIAAPPIRTTRPRRKVVSRNLPAAVPLDQPSALPQTSVVASVVRPPTQSDPPLPVVQSQPQPQPQVNTTAVAPPPPAKVPAPKPPTMQMVPSPAFDAGNVEPAPQNSAPAGPPSPAVVPTPPSPPLADAPRPAIRQPALGRSQGDLIWSGQLEKGMQLTIDGSNASAGNLRGDPLPGVPVMLSLQPADVIVAQAPMSSDTYTRFVLRSPAHRNTVVRVHWEILK